MNRIQLTSTESLKTQDSFFLPEISKAGYPLQLRSSHGQDLVKISSDLESNRMQNHLNREWYDVRTR